MKSAFNNSIISSFFALLIAFPQNAHAAKFEVCNEAYSHVDSLFLNISSTIPDVGNREWKNVADFLKRSNLKFATDVGLNVQTTELNAEEVFKSNPQALYVRLNYSYADKKLFSTPLESGVLAIWADIQSNQSGSSPKAIHTPPKFLRFDPTDSAREMVLSSAPHGLIEGVACEILRYTKGKVCTNKQDFSKNKVIDQKNSCVPPSKS